jgi:Chaperone of endosialidase
MGKPSAPPAPDYAAAAKETAQGNANAARIAQYGNMTNQITPQGTVSYTPSTMGYMDEKGNTITSEAYNALTDKTGYSPLQQWTQTVGLSPDQQALYDQSVAMNKDLGNIAQSGLSYVKDAMGKPIKPKFDVAGSVPTTTGKMTRNVDMPDLQTDVGSAGPLQRGIQNNADLIQTSIANPELLAQNTTNALYKANTQYLDPQFAQSQAKLENQLANQGITRGSEAYNNAMLNFNNQKQQAYESARNQAVGGGIQAAQGMFGMNLQGGQFANQALGQQFGQGLQAGQFANQAQQQQYDQLLNNANFRNAALQGMFGMGMQNAALNNQVQNQAFAQGLSNAQLQNAASQQDISQQQTLQQAPINMLNAVRTGQQLNAAQLPQVGVSQPGQLANWQGPDMLGAAQAQGQYNQGIYNAQSAAASNLTGSLIGAAGMLGGAALMSDLRLKKNIIKLGIHKTLGIGLYTWDYLWGEKGAGVMAQELEQVMPEAVITMPNGFKAVNYSMLGV